MNKLFGTSVIVTKLYVFVGSCGARNKVSNRFTIGFIYLRKALRLHGYELFAKVDAFVSTILIQENAFLGVRLIRSSVKKNIFT